MAARFKHRKSTDIDTVVRNQRTIEPLNADGGAEFARRLGGTVVVAESGQVKVETDTGIIDLNTAPVIPQTGGETVKIAGRAQGVLSTAQILRGKFERATTPGPVRDAYDVIRAATDETARGHVVAAYGLLVESEQDEIEEIWTLLDSMYEDEAETELNLTEEPRADRGMLGSTAAVALNKCRLKRVVIELTNERDLSIRRETRGGPALITRTDIESWSLGMAATGVNIIVGERGGSHREIGARIETMIRREITGVVFDTNAEQRQVWHREPAPPPRDHGRRDDGDDGAGGGDRGGNAPATADTAGSGGAKAPAPVRGGSVAGGGPVTRATTTTRHRG